MYCGESYKVSSLYSPHCDVLATKKLDTTKKDGYSMTFDYNIYRSGKLIEKGLKSKELAIDKASNLTLTKTKK